MQEREREDEARACDARAGTTARLAGLTGRLSTALGCGPVRGVWWGVCVRLEEKRQGEVEQSEEGTRRRAKQLACCGGLL